MWTCDRFNGAPACPRLQYVTLVNPLRYAIEIAERVYLEGAGMEQLMPDLWPLVVIALGMLSAAAWLFRHPLT
jgi:ABC-2 type transport system permease protein